MDKTKYKENLIVIKDVIQEIESIEKTINLLNTKLGNKQKLLKDLQNHQNLIHLLHYNLLSKEKDVNKISQGLKKIIDSASVVIKKLPPQLQEQIKEQIKVQIKNTSKKANLASQPIINKIESQIEKTFTHTKKKVLQGVQTLEELYNLAKENAIEDKESIEKKYLEYKKYCEIRGQKLASKEEFKRMITIFNGFKKEVSQIDINNIVSRLYAESNVAKDTFLSLIIKAKFLIQEALDKSKFADKKINTADLTKKRKANGHKFNLNKVEKTNTTNRSKDRVKAKSNNIRNNFTVVGSKVIRTAKKTYNPLIFRNWIEAKCVIVTHKSEYTNYEVFYTEYLKYMVNNHKEEKILDKSHFTIALHKSNSKIKFSAVKNSRTRLINVKILN